MSAPLSAAHPSLRDVHPPSFQTTIDFSLVKLRLEEQNSQAAAIVLISLTREHPQPGGDELSDFCEFYERIQNSSYQKELFQAFVIFLKTLLQHSLEANRKLVDCIQNFFTLKVSPLYIRLWANLLLYKLCTYEDIQKQLASILLQDFKQLELFEIPLSGPQPFDMKEMLDAATATLGEASFCLNTQFLQAANQGWAFGVQDLPKEMNLVYFAKQTRCNLKTFRELFEKCFEEKFSKKNLKKIDPKQVRDFQHQIFCDFKTHFLDPLLSLPLTILAHKKIETEWMTFGSLSREELTPGSDFEGIIILREGPQLTADAELLRKLSLFLGVQVLGIGETPIPLGNELFNYLSDGSNQKGFFFDELPNCSTSPLREINNSFPIAAIPLITLETLHLLQQENALIDKETKSLEQFSSESEEKIYHWYVGKLTRIQENIILKELKPQISKLLEILAQKIPLSARWEQYSDALRELKNQTIQNLALRAFLEKIQQLEEEKDRKQKQELRNYLKKEETLSSLQECLKSEAGETFLFSCLKVKRLGQTGRANFGYQEGLKVILEAPVENIPRRERKAKELLWSLRKEYIERFGGPSFRAKAQELFARSTINLKDELMQPLFYLLATLAIYFGIEETNTLDIVDHLQALKFFDETSATLLRETLSAIYLIRLRLHFAYGKGCDVAVQAHQQKELGKQSFTQKEQVWVNRAYLLVLPPLYRAIRANPDCIPQQIDLFARLSHRWLQTLETEKEAQEMVQEVAEYTRYLIDTEQLKKIFDFHHLLSQKACLEPLRRVMYTLSLQGPQEMRSLSLIPHQQTGFRYSYLEEYQKLHTRLMDLTTDIPPSEGIQVKILTVLWKDGLIPPACEDDTTPTTIQTRYLKSDYIEKFLDESILNGVKSSANQEKTLLLKRQYPNSLHRVVKLETKQGEGIHFKERPTHATIEFAIVSLFYRFFGRGVTPSVMSKVQIACPDGSSFLTAVAISLSQEGTTLNELAQQPDFPSRAINPEELSEQQISHLMILPSDARGPNMMVTHLGQFVSLDLEASFVPVRLNNSREVSFISELFCHDFFPYLSEETLNRFQKIQAFELLSAWLRELSTLTRAWMKLFETESFWLLNPIVDPQDPCKPEREVRCVSPCLLLAPGTIARLYLQIIHLQTFFKQNKSPITSLDLLEHLVACWDNHSDKIGKHLAKRYRQSRKILLGFSRPPHERLQAVIGIPTRYSKSSSLTLQQLLDHLPSREELDKHRTAPEESLNELLKIHSFYEKGINLRLFGPKDIVQCDQEHNLDAEEQKIFLSLLLQSRSIVYLALPNFTSLSDEILEALLNFNGHTLKTLDLRGCTAISITPFLTHISRLQGLEELSFANQPLANLEIKPSLLGDSKPLFLPSLRKISIEDCTGISEVHLVSPALKYVRIKGDVNLQFSRDSRSSYGPPDCSLPLLEGLHLVGARKGIDLRFLEKLQLHRLKSFVISGNFYYFQEQMIGKIIRRTALEKLVVNINFNWPSKLWLTLFGNPLPEHIPTHVEIFAPVIISTKEEMQEILLLVEKYGVKKMFNDPEQQLQSRSLWIGSKLIKENIKLTIKTNDVSDLTDMINLLPDWLGKQVVELDINQCLITHKEIRLINKILATSKITRLNLSGNCIGNAGIKELTQQSFLANSCITSLDLSGNQIGGDEVARAIAQNLPHSKIIRLDLSGNLLNDQDAAIIAHALNKVQSFELDLSYNEIGTQGTEEINQILMQKPWVKLRIKKIKEDETLIFINNLKTEVDRELKNKSKRLVIPKNLKIESLKKLLSSLYKWPSHYRVVQKNRDGKVLHGRHNRQLWNDLKINKGMVFIELIWETSTTTWSNTGFAGAFSDGKQPTTTYNYYRYDGERWLRTSEQMTGLP